MGSTWQPRLGYADILPYFKRYETRLGNGSPVYRGKEGEQVITDLEWRHPLCDAFIQAATDMGIPLMKIIMALFKRN